MKDLRGGKPRILIIDDDSALLETAELMLTRWFEVSLAKSVNEGRLILRRDSIDVAVVDLDFAGQEEDGLAMIDWLLESMPELPLVVLSGDRNTKRVIEATKRRVIDFVAKPCDFETDLKPVIQKALELKKLRLSSAGSGQFLTRSPLMNSLLRKVDLLIERGGDCPVLIVGETGTGKEVLAKYIASKNKKKLVPANMGAIPRETAESVLFGHMKGAFTGAHMNHIGLIEQAHQGIFFLDELGECTSEIQVKLLRVLQEQEICPHGGLPRKISVRFLAATNQDLDLMVRNGTFRLDLLQRLDAMRLEIPPLRKRPEDIEYYTTLFLEKYSQNEPFTVKADGLHALMGYCWPGNVRQLEHVIQKIVILSNRRVLDADAVFLALESSQHLGLPDSTQEFQPGHREMRLKVLSALENSNGNRTLAAESIKMHRVTFQRWIKKLGIGDFIGAKVGRPAQELNYAAAESGKGRSQ